MFCLVMRNVYQGALFDFLQSDGRHKQFEKIAEMIDKNLTFYYLEIDMIFSGGASNQLVNIIFYCKHCIDVIA